MGDDGRHRPYALVVDDNPVILLHAVEFFEEIGFSTFAAADCDQALAVFAEHGAAIDMMVANIWIPGPMDGLDLARFVAARWAGTGIIVMSGHVTPDATSLPDGAVFLSKPFTPADIGASVRRLLTDRAELLARLSLDARVD